ncbi:MAG: hypothetical protein ACF787_13535, partial [Rhodopirellula sp. JB053]
MNYNRTPASATGWRKQKAENRFDITHRLHFRRPNIENGIVSSAPLPVASTKEQSLQSPKPHPYQPASKDLDSCTDRKDGVSPMMTHSDPNLFTRTRRIIFMLAIIPAGLFLLAMLTP